MKFEVIYQTRETVFHHISKHREESTTRKGVLLTKFNVSSVWYNISIEFKTNKRRNKTVKIYAN